MDVDIAIVGSGFSGLGLAVRLRREGIEDFVVLERGDGRRRDVALQHLSRLRLRRALAPVLVLVRAEPGLDADLLAASRRSARTCERVVDEFGVRAHIHLEREVTGAAWDEDASAGSSRRRRVTCARECWWPARARWSSRRSRTSRGSRRFAGRDDPLRPLGPRRRPARASGWRASAPARRRSSTCPRIAPDVEQLYVLQRTPPWVMPHSARPISRLRAARLQALPGRSSARSAAASTPRVSCWCSGWSSSPSGMKLLERVGPPAHRERRCKDPALLAKATPDYTVGCKRILPSNDWYPALARENVELVTEGVAEVRPHSVVLSRRARARGRRARVRHRLPGPRHAGRAAGPRARRPHAGRHLERLPARAPGRDRPRLPELLHPARPEHRARAHVGRLHDRVADRLRAGCAARDARRGADSSR